MEIFNTKSRKKETFKPLSSREVKAYSCGPTVYNYVHIGNLRAYTFEDIVVKTLRYLGYNVKYLMNITDVDDKTIRDSIAAHKSLKDFTEKYTSIFLEDIKKLNITPADEIVPVTTLITEMVRMINTMLRRGFAYLASDGSIYFKVSEFKNYGKFANLDMSHLKESVRIDNDEYDKEKAADFVLWKAWKETDGDNFWDEEFTLVKSESQPTAGFEIVKEDEKEITVKIKGRPGWHIECSACNMKYHGQQIDIHMGGEDLIFPHHQNEIAQTESCTRKEFSRYWLHNGHLMVDGKKMSKSLGNFYTLKDLEEKFSDIKKSVLYRAIRLSFMMGKYREVIDFSFSKLEANINSINKIDETLRKIDFTLQSAPERGVSKEFREEMQLFIAEYIASLEDDFNTPEALAVFYNFMKFVNSGLSEQSFSLEELKSIKDMLETFNQVFSIIDFESIESEVIPPDILVKLDERNAAKKEKNFALADAIRDELLQAGYKIIDSREGSRVEKI
ncbi:MAG: cysteine--tRNA ligase [Candidatus Gracilibacteria bacterium]|nr:cysteine--tRNA ligase [Candidatus Gracilibacteria bacterium]